MFQVQIVKTCRELGLGSGGFYQPGYHDGAKLRLQMMCLGKNWDPQTKYKEGRRKDGSEPPGIPDELTCLVKKALEDSNSLIKKHFGAISLDNTIPSMTPDICIVNFYTTNGRLGLHQVSITICEMKHLLHIFYLYLQILKGSFIL